MNRRFFGWQALLLGAGLLTVLLWPAGSGQGAQWLVTVGAGDPELVEVTDRVVPLRFPLEGTRPVPNPVRARLAAAAVLGLGTLVGTLMWFRRRTV